MPFTAMTLAQLAVYLDKERALSPDEQRMLKRDQRSGARQLLERYRRREERRRREDERLHMMLREERVFWQQGFKNIAGIDEAGRGPLAGPVVAAAVILPPHTVIRHLDDSKRLTAARRDELFVQIKARARGWAVGICSPGEIDRLNIFAAAMQAMRAALSALPLEPDMVLVDGFPLRGIILPQKAIPGGDALSLSIAAASVVAKVTRDRIMCDLHRSYPEYGFDRHKGYGTSEHRLALARHGPCPEHRRSFRGSGFDSGPP